MNEVKIVVSKKNEIVFSKYFQELTPLIIEAQESSDSWQEVWDFLEKNAKEHPSNEAWQNLMKAERLFYEGQHAKALEIYKTCQPLVFFSFFVARAEAFVSFGNKEMEQSEDFLKKSLEILSNDYISLDMMVAVLKSQNKKEEAEEFSSRLNVVEQVHSETEEETPVGLAPQERDDLKDLFSTSSNPVDSLQQESLPEIKSLQELEKTLIQSNPDLSQSSVSSSSLDLSQFSEEMGLVPAKMHNSPMPVFDNEDLIKDFSKKTTSEFIRETLGVDISSDSSLEMRIKAFKKRHARLMTQYVEQSSKRTHFDDHFMYILNGWDYGQAGTMNNKISGMPTIDGSILEESKGTSGGYYVRWNGKGIVVNPGANFLKYFHEQELFIKDIDYVIVTRCEPEYYQDVKAIYNLNYEHNTLSKELHIIKYYLNEATFEALSTQLKPRFKQERHSIQCLDLYQDSPDVETVNLDDVITLDYFHTLPSSSQNGEASKNIGICLRLKKGTSFDKAQEHDFLVIGYLSGVPWDASLAPHLSNSDIIIGAFEQTNPNDYNKVEFNKNSLGYHGTYNLIDQVNPQLFIFSEFKGQEGDIRLEVAKKLRQDFAYKKNHQTVTLPGDCGMYIELKTLRLRCSISRSFVIPSESRVVKPLESWGNLQYLSPSCFV
jgi:hypothetical protein